MSNRYQSLTLARWHENAEGVPDNPVYGDVYHARVGALTQARQVFLHGNGLPQRWRGRARFTICETGFGLGHNFLATWQAWADDPQRSARLHYLAFEAHPFRVQDLRRAWDRLPDDVRLRAGRLARAWPALLPGWHRIELAGGLLTLTLAFGDVRRVAHQAQAWVDAFYLDGFAPRCNPEMWSPAVFGQLRRLSAAGATAATWCAAGQVRRDLQAAGFLVRKVRGIDGKRDMTVAEIRPGLSAAPGRRQLLRVAVVGAGLAGAGVAQALGRRGHQVTVWDRPADEAHPLCLPPWGAALIPALSPDDDTRSRLSRVGLELARTRWLDIDSPGRPVACGALQCATSPTEAARQQHALAQLRFPETWARWLDATAASRQAGVSLRFGAIWFPQALQVHPPLLGDALLRSPVVRRLGAVARLKPAGGESWQLLDMDGTVLDEADHVVLAAGAQVRPLLASAGPLAAWPVLSRILQIAGQLSFYAIRDAADCAPRCIVSGEGYCLPPFEGYAVAGSTYVRNATDSRVTDSGHRAITARLATWLPAGAPSWLAREPVAGWAGWRAATRDHLPLIGAVPGHKGLWLACGYGSRGTSWCALAGEVIAACLDAEPLPVERELLHRIRVR